MHELRDAPELDLGQLLERLERVDIVLIEGFKRGRHPKIEVHRAVTGGELLFVNDPTICAFVSDVAIATVLPSAALADYERIADFIVDFAAPYASVA